MSGINISTTPKRCDKHNVCGVMCLRAQSQFEHLLKSSELSAHTIELKSLQHDPIYYRVKNHRMKISRSSSIFCEERFRVFNRSSLERDQAKVVEGWGNFMILKRVKRFLRCDKECRRRECKFIESVFVEWPENTRSTTARGFMSSNYIYGGMLSNINIWASTFRKR